MECTIKTVINSVTDYGKRDVTFRLTTEELIALKHALLTGGRSIDSLEILGILMLQLDKNNIKG